MRVAVLDDYHAAFEDAAPIQRLRQRAEVRVFTKPLTSEERVRELKGVDVAIALRERTRFDTAFFRDAPDLRLIVQTGRTGPHLDITAATAAGVQISIAGGGSSVSTVELTIALMLALLRQIPQSDRRIREGRWEGQWSIPHSRVLNGRTLGILGLGRIGRQVARLARDGFGMEVLAWSRSITQARAAEVGAQAVSLEEALSRPDVVSVHLALNEGTVGLLDAPKLRLMKPGAYFINTSRGAVLDEATLVKLLTEGKLAGAALDVFTEEPLPATNPLTKLENVVLTPHIGWPSDASYAAFAEATTKNIEAYLDGAAPNVVNPEAQDKSD